MTKQEFIEKIENMREEGENDLRTVLYFAKQLEEPQECEELEYKAYKLIKNEIKGCLDREREKDKQIQELQHKLAIIEKALELAYDLIHWCEERLEYRTEIPHEYGYHYFLSKAEQELKRRIKK